MVNFILLCVGICVIIYFVKQKNKTIRDKVMNSWLSVTATITNFEERIETDSEGDKFTVYIAHGEYYIDNIPYYFEERINQNDMYNISYMNVFFNPIEPTEYITEKSLNSAIVQTKKSCKNYIQQNKINTSQNNDLNNKVSNIFLIVFLIPFIIIPIFMINLFAGSIIQRNVEYKYVSKNWTLTSANITNIEEKIYYDDEGSTTTYIAQGEYVVDGITYTCSKEVPSDNEKSFTLYYNPQDASQYSVRTKEGNLSLYMILIFCIFWMCIVTVFICQLKNPIKIIYLLIMYGGTILSIIHNLKYTFIP